MIVVNVSKNTYVYDGMTVHGRTVQEFDSTQQSYTDFFNEPVIQDAVRRKQLYTLNSYPDSLNFIGFKFLTQSGAKMQCYARCIACHSLIDLETGEHVAEGGAERVEITNITVRDGCLYIEDANTHYRDGTWGLP